MRLAHLRLRGYRNLADTGLDVPAEGMALVGENGHGKTNLLEAIYYPVLLRSFRGAGDGEVVAEGSLEFGLGLALVESSTRELDVRFVTAGRQKRCAPTGWKRSGSLPPLGDGSPWSSCRET